MVEENEEVSIEELQQEISKRQTWIASIESRLPYADGGAYSQDKDQINRYSQEMRTIHAELRNRNND